MNLTKNQKFYFNFIERMNDDETKFENCDKIFDVLKWTNFNEFEWTCVAMIEQRIVVIFEKWTLYLQKNDCKVKWSNKINEYIECEMLIFVAW